MAPDQGLLLEGGDGAPRLAQAAPHTLLQPEHAHWSQAADLREQGQVREAMYILDDMIASFIVSLCLEKQQDWAEGI